MRGLALVLCLWGMATSSVALAAERSFVLPNGLRVSLIEVPGTTRAAILLDVAVGSADEDPSMRGIAHLAEHLYARGKPDGDRFATRAVQLGGERINAGTDFDRTNFYWTVPVENLAAAIAMEAARLRDPRDVVAAGAFATEKRIVVAEMREMAWQLDTRVKTVAFPRIFGAGHSHSVLPIGTERSVGRIDQAMLQAWFGRWYAPGNMRLIVAGPFVAHDVEPMIRRQFTAPGTPVLPRDLRPLELKGAVSAGVVTIEAATAAVTLYGAAPPLSHGQSAALEWAVANIQDTFAEAVRARYGEGATGTLWYRASERAGNVGARIVFSGYEPVAGAENFVADWLSFAELSDTPEVEWGPAPRPPAGTPLGVAFSTLLGDDQRRASVAAASLKDAKAAFSDWFRSPLLAIRTNRRTVSEVPILRRRIGRFTISAVESVNPDLLLVTLDVSFLHDARAQACENSSIADFPDELRELLRERLGWTYSVSEVADAHEDVIGSQSGSRTFSFHIPHTRTDQLLREIDSHRAWTQEPCRPHRTLSANPWPETGRGATEASSFQRQRPH